MMSKPSLQDFENGLRVARSEAFEMGGTRSGAARHKRVKTVRFFPSNPEIA
jgi:hypothetical protein